MREKRFAVYETSEEDHVESMENRNTTEKTKRDVQRTVQSKDVYVLFEARIFDKGEESSASRIEQIPCIGSVKREFTMSWLQL